MPAASTLALGSGGKVEQDSQLSKLAKEKEKGIVNTVPFYKLYSFAYRTGYMLMFVGTVGAVGNGVCMPLMILPFSDLIHSFVDNQNKNGVVRAVSKVSLEFVYLAAGAGVAAFLSIYCKTKQKSISYTTTTIRKSASYEVMVEESKQADKSRARGDTGSKYGDEQRA